MLLLVVIALVVVSGVHLAIKRNHEAMGVFALCASLAVLVFSTCVFIAKRGGISKELELFLFFLPQVCLKLQYMLITLKALGFIMAIGRYLFPLFFVWLALQYSMTDAIRKALWLYPVASALPLVTLFAYWPPVFEAIADNFGEVVLPLIVKASRVWTALYIIIGVALMLWELYCVTMAFFRRQFLLKVLFIVSLAVLYMLYSQQDPAQVYLFYKNEFMSLMGIWYLSPQLHWGSYVVALVSSAVFGALGFTVLLKYTRINYSEDKNDIVMERKFNIARSGASVFVHSIKNQLLANRVQLKRLRAELYSENQNKEKILEHVNGLYESNELIIARSEELYRTVKSKSVRLVPVALTQIAKKSLNSFYKKYPEGKVETEELGETQVLADETYLSDAIYNLLINGWEANLAGGKADVPVKLISHAERLYTVLEVRDDGVGIPYAEQKKVFDPFYSSKNSNFNWGMGLYHVRTIVKSHLGGMRIESKPGQGTSFYVLLPKYGKAPLRRKHSGQN